MVTSTTTAQSLIAEQVSNMLVKPLESASVILGSGAQVINSSSPVRIPTIGNHTPLGWVGENELIPEGDSTFGEISLMPTDRKSIKTIVRVSNELIRSATVGVSAALQSRMVNDVRELLDTELLTGTGADGGVTGLTNQPGIGTGAYDPTDMDSILDGLAAMAADEITPTHLIVNPADYFTMRKVKDADGRPLLQPDLTAGVQYRLHGVAVVATNKLPAGQAVLADMPSVVVVRDIDPDVTILNERYAEYDQVGIRVRTRYDLGLTRPEGVTLLTAATGA